MASSAIAITPYFIFPAISGIWFIVLSFFVFLNNKKSIVNVTFSLIFFTGSIWLFGYTAAYLIKDEKLAYLIIKLLYIGVIFIPSCLYHFVVEFLEQIGQRKHQKWDVFIPYTVSVISAVLLFTTNKFLSGTYKYFWGYYAKAGILHTWFIIFLFFVYFISIFRLYRGYKKAKDSVLVSNRIRYAFLGFFTGFFGMLDFIPNYGFEFYPPGALFMAIGASILSYAILRHQLMDITIVIRKTAIYSIVATIITMAYFILIYIVEGLFRGFMGYKSIPWTLSVIIMFTLIFQPLKNMVQIFVDRHFFKGSQALLQEELKKAQEELKRSERLKAVGTLAAGMAHEIKNPLTGIKTFTEYLGTNYKDPNFIEKFQRIVGAEVNKINDIVQQLLDFSKPKPLQLKPCDIHTLLDQTISFLSNDFIKNNINVNKNYDSGLPLLNIDHNQIQQVFLNLFLNSIDAMKQGGTLTISTSLQNAAATITIQDTGTGISKKDLEHIFDPFYSTKEKGTGLGMSIVYGIIKEHKGEISVESEVGSGTKFSIKLPIGL